MDLSAVSSSGSFNYQSALKLGAQTVAALPGLGQAKAGLSAPLPEATEAATPDALTQLAGSSVLGALVNGIYSASAANGGGTSSVQGVSAVGGMEASSVSALTGGSPSGFPTENIAASEALASYKYQQSMNGAPNTSNSAATTYVQQLGLTAQAASLLPRLNLLA